MGSPELANVFVSPQFTLISGKIQGISAVLAPKLGCDHQIKVRNQMLARQIPYAIEQGIILFEQGRKILEQEV